MTRSLRLLPPLTPRTHRAAMLALSVLALLTAAPTAAQPSPDRAPEAHHDVVLVVRSAEHVRAALKTAAALYEGRSFSTNRVEIIVCGQASDVLLQGSETAGALRAAAGKGVVLTACGMSLERAGIDPAQLLDVVTVVPNGLLRALELQAQGYLSVEL